VEPGNKRARLKRILNCSCNSIPVHIVVKNLVTSFDELNFGLSEDLNWFIA